jgi:hypothetical protein
MSEAQSKFGIVAATAAGAAILAYLAYRHFRQPAQPATTESTFVVSRKLNHKLPVYVIDFDEPAETRYNKMFEDYKGPLLEMENYWYSVIPESCRKIIRDNI